MYSMVDMTAAPWCATALSPARSSLQLQGPHGRGHPVQLTPLSGYHETAAAPNKQELLQQPGTSYINTKLCVCVCVLNKSFV